MEVDESHQNLNASVIQTYDMAEGVENMFNVMVEIGKFDEAIEFISRCLQQIPHFTVIRTVIFKIVMKNCEAKVAEDSSLYLSNILELYSPMDQDRRKFYYEALRETSGVYSELWSVFSHIVKSSLDHYNIFDDYKDEEAVMIKYPNCDVLLNFYILVFLKDFELFSLERDIKEKRCIVMLLFWPTSEIETIKNNGEMLLKWIADIYRIAPEGKVFVFRQMHELLCLMVKCIILRKGNLPDTIAFSSPYLTDIVKAILKICKDVFGNLQSLKRFIASCPLKYLQAKICEEKLSEMMNSNRTSDGTSPPLTLKKVVDMYMFPGESKCKKSKGGRKPVLPKNKRPKKKFSLKKNTRGNTELHEACKEKKFGELLELLRRNEDDINVKNSAGYVPLHIACMMKSYLCAKVLIKETKKENEQADLKSKDNEGLTPLHYAVGMDAFDIVNMLLLNGGNELLSLTDSDGLRPIDYSPSPEMTELLMKSQPNNDTAANKITEVVKKKAPVFDNYKNYSIYLHSLHILLCLYDQLFKIRKYLLSQKQGLSQFITKNHDNKECAHFVFSSEGTVCSEDVSIAKEIPNLINDLVESIKSHTKKMQINLQLEFIPIKSYAASLL